MTEDEALEAQRTYEAALERSFLDFEAKLALRIEQLRDQQQEAIVAGDRDAALVVEAMCSALSDVINAIAKGRRRYREARR